MRWILTLVGVALSVSSPCYGEWAVTLNPGDEEEALCIHQTTDGGYILAGWSYADLYGEGYEGYVFKLNSHGKTVWGRYVENCTYIRTVMETFDAGGNPDGYVLGGCYQILKLDPDGSGDWAKSYNASIRSLQPTFDGHGSPDGYIVTGGCSGLCVLKLTLEGTVGWHKSYSGEGWAYGYSVQQTLDDQGEPDGYIVAGGTDSFGADNEDFWVLRLDLEGAVIWEKTYGGIDEDIAYSVYQSFDKQGNPEGYIVAGDTRSYGAGGYDIWVLKLRADGTVAWQRTYGKAGKTAVRSIQQTEDCGYVLAGTTRTKGNLDIWILKLDHDGAVAWQNTYGGEYDEEGNSVQQTVDGGYIVAGGGSKFWMLKLDHNGAIPGCSAVGESPIVVSDTSVEGEDTSVLPNLYDPDWSEVAPSLEAYTPYTTTVCGVPVIDKVRSHLCEPGDRIRIIGSFFGDVQGNSSVHINRRTYGPGHPKIKLWSDTRIKVEIPRYKCEWFKDQYLRRRRIWVTVGGLDSNKKGFKVVKPGRCP